MADLTALGRAARVAATGVGLVLLLAGTVVGQDDAFPFGPFRMYATTDDGNRPVASTRVEAVDAAGRRFVLTGGSSGLRRAEVEGQMGRFRSDPALLGALARAYARRNPDRPELVRVEIVVRRYALDDRRPTGEHTDAVELVWTAP